MKLALAALAEAVRKHLSHEIAAAIPATAATMARMHEPPELIADSDVGELLLRILLGGLTKAPVELSAIHLTLPTDSISLDPEDVTSHPLLIGIPDDLAEAIGAPIIAGARGWILALGWPTFRQVDVVRAGGEVYGALHFVAAGAGCALPAMAMYGRLCDVPMMQTCTLFGSALYEIGRAARSATQSAGAPPAPPATSGFRIVGVEAAGSGAVH